MPIFYFHWILSILKLDKKKRFSIIIGYILTTIFFTLSFTDFYIQGTEQKLQFPFWPNGSFLYLLYILLLYIGLSGRAILYLFHQKKVSTGYTKDQINYLIIGSIVGFGCGITNFPLWFDIPIAPFGNLFVPFYVFIFTYAVIKYRLMDIRIIIRKSVIYSILSAIFLGLAAFGIILLSTYITPALNTTFIIGAALISMALALLFLPAKKLVQKAVNAVIFTKTPVYEDQIVLVKQTLRNGQEFKKLFAKMEEILKQTLKTDEIFVAIKNHSQNALEEHYSHNLICSPIALDSPLIKYLEEKKDPIVKEEIPYMIEESQAQKDMLNQAKKFLSKARAEIALPLLQDEKVIGLLLLGKKQNEESYSSNDIGFLESFQKDFSFALSNTLLYEAALARAKQPA